MTDFHKEKTDKLIEEMKKGGADALLLFPGTDIGYYTGFSIEMSERLAAALIPFDGEPLIIVNELEKGLRGQESWIKEVDFWLEHENPIEILAENIERLKLDKAVIGISENAPWGWINKLSHKLPSVLFVDASQYISHERMIKTFQELEWMRMACAITDRVLEKSFERLHTGLTERELVFFIESEIKSQGGDIAFVSVLFGDKAALPHGESEETPLKPGMGVLIDVGTKIHGYNSDLTRTAFYGEPTVKQERIYKLVMKANQEVVKIIKPGETCENLDRVARKVINEGGFGKYFIHRLGHGIGLDIHERPYIVRNNILPLEPGMTFTIEPGIYIKGEIGVRVEDTVVCTQEGYESLTRMNRDLKFYPVVK